MAASFMFARSLRCADGVHAFGDTAFGGTRLHLRLHRAIGQADRGSDDLVRLAIDRASVGAAIRRAEGDHADAGRLPGRPRRATRSGVAFVTLVALRSLGPIGPARASRTRRSRRLATPRRAVPGRLSVPADLVALPVPPAPPVPPRPCRTRRPRGRLWPLAGLLLRAAPPARRGLAGPQSIRPKEKRRRSEPLTSIPAWSSSPCAAPTFTRGFGERVTAHGGRARRTHHRHAVHPARGKAPRAVTSMACCDRHLAACAVCFAKA